MSDSLAPNLAALVEMLRKRDLDPPDVLDERINNHVSYLQGLADAGRPVDIDVARKTAGLCLGMLSGWDAHDDAQRKLIQAAALYFLEEEDDDDDTEPGGFDDDLAVARWVAQTLADAD